MNEISGRARLNYLFIALLTLTTITYSTSPLSVIMLDAIFDVYVLDMHTLIRTNPWTMFQAVPPWLHWKNLSIVALDK